MVAASSCKNRKKAMDVTDPQEAAEMVEEQLTEEREAIEPEEEIVENPEKRVAVYEPTLSERLDGSFAMIAGAASVSQANAQIDRALQMFSNDGAPVLVIFYRSDGQEDYDEPTTISKYLHYLKDTKNNKASVEEMVMDGNGKIKELVLKKN